MREMMHGNSSVRHLHVRSSLGFSACRLAYFTVVVDLYHCGASESLQNFRAWDSCYQRNTFVFLHPFSPHE